MNNLLSLIKVDFLGSFGNKNSKKNSKVTSFRVIVGTVVLLGLAISTLYNFLFVPTCKEYGVPYIYIQILFVSITSLLALTTSVFKMKGLFVGKDYDMLAAMPISKTTIISSKIISLYLVELLYSFIVLIPNTIFLTIYSANPIYIATGVAAMILAPAVPMMLACVVAMFIAMIADKTRFGSIISTFLYLAFFVGIMVISMMTSQFRGDDAAAGYNNMFGNMSSWMKWINPSTVLLELSVTSNFAYLLIYIGANVALTIAIILFIALFYDRVHDICSSNRSNIKYVKKDLQTVGTTKTLLISEYKRLFSSKYYFVNSCSSGIMSIVFSIIMVISFTSATGDQSEQLLELINPYIFWSYLIVSFMIGIATPASVSISIEGGNFWMIKSMPVDYKKLMRIKLFVSISLLGPCAAIGALVCCSMLKASVLTIIITPILALLYVCVASLVGLDINLSRYKLKWKNEMEVVKNSSAVVLSMFADWGITLVLAGASIGLSFVNPLIAIFTTLGVLIALIAVFFIHIQKTCVRRMTAIEEF